MHNTHDFGGGARRGGKNKQWVASAMDQPLSSGSGGRPRGSHGHGKGRGGGGLKNNGYHSEPDEVKPTSSKPASPYEHLENTAELDDPVFAPLFVAPEDEPANQTMEEKEAVYKDLVHLWELEAKVAVRTGKMSSEKGDIHNPITMAGTCMHMCSRRERYRREREFNLEVWEQLPGTRYVDHPHAVTKYERARGDKVTPSDLRPLPILKATMDYMLQDLMSRGGFEATHSFIRDRTRQIRADLTIQRLASPVVLECIERCMRFHILAFRKMRDDKSFDKPTETGLLSNCTQSLKELYNDLRDESEFGPAYAFPCEVEMWIYRCLIFIRNQGPEQIPPQIQAHPLYKLAVQFRSHVQSASGTITRSSELKVGGQGMATFQQLVEKLLETEDGRPMVFMVACLLDSIFGTGTVKEIDDLREGYTDLDLIVRAEPSEADEQVDEAEEEEVEVEVEDGTEEAMEGEEEGVTEQDVDDMESDLDDETLTVAPETVSTSTFLPPVTASAFQTASSSSGFPPSASAFPNSSISPLTANAFTKITSTSNVFGNRPSAFGNIGAGNAFTAIAASSSRPNGSLFGSPSTQMNSSPFSLANRTSTLPTPAGAAPVTNSFGGGGTNTIFDPLNPKAPEFVPSFGHLTNMPPPALPVPMQPQAVAPVAPVAPSQPIHQPQPAKPIFGVSSTGLASSSSGPVLPSLTIKINEPITPINPPALQKVQPVSLPSTPTAPPLQSGFFNLTAGLGEPLIQPMKTGNRLLASLRTDLAPSAGMLSPLVMTPSSTPLRTSFSPTKQISPPDRKGKGKATDIDLETQAREFESRGLLVRESFKRWQKLATDHAEWIAACQRGERYSAKIRSRRYGRSLRDDDEESSASMSVTPTKRRRQRTYQPRKTDDELLLQFEENKAEHDRRWAPGSFLQIIRKALKLKSQWHIWLSLNPEVDATAIWVQTKFDVEKADSSWVNETVLAIPVIAPGKGYPGLVVFECTPLGGVNDELDRKYLVLDDCSRLRDLVSALPEDRHFVPSLVFFVWQSGLEDDMLEMAKKLVDAGTITGFRVVPVAAMSDDLDLMFSDALTHMDVDVTGRLGQELTAQGVFKNLCDSVYTAFLAEWAESSEWGLISSAVEILNETANLALDLVGLSHGQRVLPPLPSAEIWDTESAFAAVGAWLRNPLLDSDGADAVWVDVRAYRDIGRDFPLFPFLEHLRELVVLDSTATYFVCTKDSLATLERLKNTARELHFQLASRAFSSSRRRRTRSVSVSEDASSSVSKRRRMSVSTSQASPPQINGNGTAHGTPIPGTPSPTLSTVSLDPAVVTVSMLRQLTQDLKSKYGKR